MAQVSVRVDDDVKQHGEFVLNSLGMSLSTAVTIFLRQVVREGKIPFEIALNNDSFYSETNIKALLQSKKQYEDGLVISKTAKELQEFE